MKLILRKAMVWAVALCGVAGAGEKVAIIKADDVWGKHAKWDRFVEMSLKKDVPVSLGVIAKFLGEPKESDVTWLRALEANEGVELWHHGWDHRRWKEGEKEVSEFGGSGFDHQNDHMRKTQAAGDKVLEKGFVTFGSPFNAMDDDTAKVLNAMPELKFIFCYPGHPVLKKMEGKVFLPMTLRGENDGVGKPNFAKFKVDYEKRKGDGLDVAALQFHPLGFSEQGFEDYGKILDFLKEKGWRFVLPRDYEAK
ncbi:MAG: DUF2334 domain-containing protein [Verrucomicrobiales bacterium]